MGSFSPDDKNAQHAAILQSGVDAWNTRRSQHPDVRPRLAEFKLPNANLQGINLRNAYLFFSRLF
jgi:hypothetical protein